MIVACYSKLQHNTHRLAEKRTINPDYLQYYHYLRKAKTKTKQKKEIRSNVNKYCNA